MGADGFDTAWNAEIVINNAENHISIPQIEHFQNINQIKQYSEIEFKSNLIQEKKKQLKMKMNKARSLDTERNIMKNVGNLRRL